MNLKEIGKRFKKLRTSKNDPDGVCTQSKLALILGLNRQEICAVENGKKAPSKKMIENYHNYFKISKEYLRGESNTKNYKYLEAGKALGLSDITIEKLYKRGDKSEYVDIINNIFDLGYEWRLLKALHAYFNSEFDSTAELKNGIKLPIRINRKTKTEYIKIKPDIIEKLCGLYLHELLAEIKEHYHDDEPMRQIIRAGNEE